MAIDDHVSTETMASVTNVLGRTVYVDPTDRRGRHLRDHGADANPHSMTMWRDALVMRPWDLVVDVGANYGEMLLGAALPPGATIIAYEPNERVLPFLRRSLQAAGLSVDLRQAAVSDHVGTATLMQDIDWSGMSHLQGHTSADDDHPHTSQTCETTTLDVDLADAGFRSACIKLDVEGHEEQALAGAQKWLESLDSCALLVEVLHMSDDQVQALSQRWCMYMRHLRTGRLIRVPDGGPAVQELLTSGILYPQDALLMSSPLTVDLDPVEEQRHDLLEVIKALDGEIDQLRVHASESASTIEAMQSSRSWRLTAPLRRGSRT